METTRQKEKQILDSLMGHGVYDRRIRPAGINSTGKDGRPEQRRL